MRIVGLTDNPDLATSTLNQMGCHSYATDPRGARAPPPGDAGELPLGNDGEGIIYELEPWELARRERLARYAAERDALAGIVIYESEYKDTSSAPESIPAEDCISEHIGVAPDNPNEFDQRPPPEWDTCEWDQTPLAQWASQANHSPNIPQAGSHDWDAIDPFPPDGLPTFYID